ncbi:MAG: SRPBCC family protein [Actinomycetota bacterium]|jgi:hypothetical protein|nr:SRPBCC family protein [Actinomycetota bacterium]
MTSEIRSRRIAAASQAVWDVLADFAGISSWADFVDHASMLHGRPLDIGSTRRIQAGSTVVLERVTEVDPPHAFTYEIEGLPKRISSVQNCWSLGAAGADATDVSITTTVSVGPRPPQRLVERVVARMLARRSDAMLAGLAAHLEAHRA